jgi:GNAT superfamily N-acetyltransferase
VEARPIPGLEHLPFAEVWLHEAGEERWREASAAAAALGKTGLEVWTTTRTPDVVSFLLARGFEEHRRYAISRLDVAAAPDPGEPAVPLVTLGERGGVAGYGYLEEQDGTWRHGSTAVARAHRGRGIAGAIKRAQIRFAKQNGIAALETANELRVPLLGLSRRLGYEHLCDEVVLRGPA